MTALQLVCDRVGDRRVMAGALAFYNLTKPRLAAMSVLSAMVAYATAGASRGAAHALATAAGTTLAAAGALALNQWWERGADAMMVRTRSRPLPRAQIGATAAFTWSLGLSCAGVALLAAEVNLLAAGLAAATIVIYGTIYTPLKRRTRWATEVGAISGALPALLGNAAAGDVWARPGLALAGILLAWQMPHFFAIGWRHRADYRAAGFRVLPAVDTEGRKTAWWSLGYAVALIVVSAAPAALGWFGAAYAIAASLAGAWFLRAAIRFVRDVAERDRRAKELFLTSIFYLPAVMGALVIEQLVGT